MSFIVNHNLMGSGVARNLNAHYGHLATSTERLSSGLRVNSAADDAAGLAIRELMRSDIATLQQGMRNANDAISLLQTADAALGIIDEKLIRMKELSEQAATGTYDSTQRLMISSEFQQMASEIDRIAAATDFNGVHLLDGSLHGPHNGRGLSAQGAMKIHFGTGNDSAEDYYYIEIPAANINGLFAPDVTRETVTQNVTIPAVTSGLLMPGVGDAASLENLQVQGNQFSFSVSGKNGGNGDQRWYDGLDRYYLPEGLKNVRIESENAHSLPFHKPHVNLFGADGSQLTGYNPDTGSAWWNGLSSQNVIDFNQTFKSGATYDDKTINSAGQSVTYGSGSDAMTISLLSKQSETFGETEVITIDEIKDGLIFIIGGHNNDGICNRYNLRITADLPDGWDADRLYNELSREIKPQETIENAVYTIETESLPSMKIDTQERAQEMLVKVDEAIVNKDKIRANIGALQNRFENTITNLTTQAENLQAAESRISDVDVATEMTDFVRNQILVQSAVAMLSQANSLPQLAMQLIG